MDTDLLLTLGILLMVLTIPALLSANGHFPSRFATVSTAGPAYMSTPW